MTSSRLTSPLIAVVASFALVSAFEILPIFGVRASIIFALVLVAFVWGAYHARSMLLSAPNQWLVPALLVASAVLALAYARLNTPDSWRSAFAWALAPTLGGWALLFWIFGESGEPRTANTWEPPRWSMPVLLIATAIFLAVLHQEAVGKWTIVSDETMYVLESVWIRQPGYTWHVDPDIVPFLLMRKTGLAENGGIMGMYTPGWPALLSLFSAVGLRWWSAVILGTGSVYVTYRLGVALHSRTVGVLAAVLIATNPIFHILHPGYLAHPATIFLLATATLLLIESETREGSGRLVRWLLVGGLLSLAIASRALTGTAVTLSLAVWMLIRQRMPFAVMLRCAVTVALGALPILAFFLHFNDVTAGSPFRLSYQALHGSGFNLGFGSRGFLGYDSELRRVRIPVDFTPRAAIEHFLGMVLGTNLNFVAYALFAPIVVLFAHYGYKPRWRVVTVFLLLPLLHFFYWATGLRVYSELLPLLLVWVAAGIVYVSKENTALAARLTIALVVSNIVLALPVRATAVPLSATWAHSAYSLSDGRFATFRRLESMAKERGKLLVFVSERVPLMDIMLDHLYQFNEKGVDSEIFVVRDLGPRNAELMRKFPNRLPLRIRDTGRDTEATIEELPRLSQATSPAPSR